MLVFDRAQGAVWDQCTRALFAALEAHPTVLRGRSIKLADRLADHIAEDPALVGRLAAAYVEQRTRGDEATRGDFFQSGPVLANIAVTLHRSGGELRTKGLDLLEQLLVLECYGARDVLRDTDRGWMS
jgi:hypothetical protein